MHVCLVYKRDPSILDRRLAKRVGGGDGSMETCRTAHARLPVLRRRSGHRLCRRSGRVPVDAHCTEYRYVALRTATADAVAHCQKVVQ